ncbi:MAG: hypoxanthine phosphoribosyltransferase [Chlamydiales bacterium]
MSTRFQHIRPDDFLVDTFALGRKVYETGFRPKHVISIWRGGAPVGLGVDAYFRSRGVFLNHTTIATESYTGVNQRGEVVVKGLDHVIDVVCPEDGLLIVDDVFESGNTIRRVVETLRERARANAPRDIRIATVHRKPERVETDDLPLITLHDLTGDVWIDYPHELCDLVRADDPEDERIRQKDAAIWSLLHGPAPVPPEIDGSKGPLTPSAHDLLLDAIRLGSSIVADRSFQPDFLVALWPGGIHAGLPVHELYRYHQKKDPDIHPPDHISLNTAQTRSSYRTDIIGIQYLVERIQRSHKILIIDTTFRSGQVVNDVLLQLKDALRRNLTLDHVRVASIYYNPTDTSTWTVPRIIAKPHYFVHEVHTEVVYPQSIHKLARPEVELRERNPRLHGVLYGRADGAGE